MPSPSGVWAHAAFALGYAEEGVFPVPELATTACLAAQEGDIAHPVVLPFVVEVGRLHGQRARREKAHQKLYDYHSARLAAALAVVLKRLDVPTLTAALLHKAAEQTAAGQAAVARRHAVAGVAYVAIAAQVHSDDRQALQAINSAGWAHATAYGTAEADATPKSGGPPKMDKVAGLAAAGIELVQPTTADAATAGWTELQLRTIAMGAALKAGDGAAVGDAARAVSDELVSTGRATKTYADGLHQAVNRAFVARSNALYPEATYNWVINSGNPCPTCTANAAGGPYTAADLPGSPPIHWGCLCNIELTSVGTPLVMATAVT